jgi:hypothetical protein
MSTRGAWGFVRHDGELLSYNHSDSYPEYLGVNLLGWLKEVEIGALGPRVDQIALVRSGDRCPDDPEKDWYSVLPQGDPEASLRLGVMSDDRLFPGDSLFCEWAYVINLDTGFFEVYKGFQAEPHSAGRFARLAPLEAVGNTYYPVKMVAAYSLTELPSSEQFLSDLNEIVKVAEAEYLARNRTANQ